MKKIYLIALCIVWLNKITGQQVNMQFTKIKGLSVAYSLAGNGPALVLLHGGFNCNSRVWKSQITNLSANFTVIAWDAPGTGKSDDTPENFTLGEWADCLSQLLDTIGVKQAHILGLSWGGLLAQVFYDRHAPYVRSLILCDTYTGWEGSLPDSVSHARMAAALADASLPPREIASKYLPSMFSDTTLPGLKEELLEILSSDFHANGFRAMVKTMAIDTRGLLAKIKVPTLLIWGESDKRSPMNVAHQFHNAIDGSRLEIISHAGHVSNMENPEQFNKTVTDFCLSVQINK
jgi:pimeloyl-ACP methyl ester carboxylesterase